MVGILHSSQTSASEGRPDGNTTNLDSTSTVKKKELKYRIMKVLKILIILFLLPVSAFSQQEELIEKARSTEKYSILKIKETKRFYILTATKKYSKDILLVVEKNSEQLKSEKPKLGKKYKFNTYSIFNVMHRNANLSHYVDGERIWIYKDGVDLRFTDSMGDDVEIGE